MNMNKPIGLASLMLAITLLAPITAHADRNALGFIAGFLQGLTQSQKPSTAQPVERGQVPQRRLSDEQIDAFLDSNRPYESFAPVQPVASNCSQYGNSAYCNDGATYSRYGNTLYDNRGNNWSTYGNTTYGSDGSSYSTYGNTTYDNRGNSWSTYGNTTYGSDGSSCSQYGNSIYCQ